MQRLFLLLLLPVSGIIIPAYGQIKPYFSVGYTSASERLGGLEDFATTAQPLNNGARIDAKQARRGYNLGIGIHSPSQGDLSPYIRFAANFSHQGGKAIDASSVGIKCKSNALDIILGMGLCNKGGAAFYTLLGPSFYRNKLSVSGATTLNGTYNVSITKFSYGLGLGYFSEKGSGLAIDALCNFKQKPKTTYYKNSSDSKFPTDMTAFSTGGAPYSGPYLSGAMGYFRIQITLFLGLGNND